jgi:hypothetical protein
MMNNVYIFCCAGHMATRPLVIFPEATPAARAPRFARLLLRSKPPNGGRAR